MTTTTTTLMTLAFGLDNGAGRVSALPIVAAVMAIEAAAECLSRVTFTTATSV